MSLKSSNGAIKEPVKNTANTVYFETPHRGKENDSSTKSVATFHTCYKKYHIQRHLKFNRNGSDGDSYETTARDIPKWVTKKPIVSVVVYLTTATMNRN